MCGIAGFVDARGTEDQLRAMCGSLAHRGPDDADARLWPDQGVGLGHRRLSIIDLSPAGRNPFPNEDGTVWVVHNGEIYNYRELRTELEAAGHRFSSSSDTEVIVHAYEAWGEDHVERLRGMFAYAVYDRRSGSPTVMLVRDRLGIKPLYYAIAHGRLAFASEMKGLGPLDWINRSLDEACVADYLTWRCVPAPKTIFAGVRKLEPGQLLLFEDPHVRMHTYWDLRPSLEENGIGTAEATAVTRDAISDAVASHMVADVPVGIFLSGGMDSSTVAAFMKDATDDAVPAYSMGFDVETHDETEYAALAARHLDLEHHVRKVSIGSVRDALDTIPTMYDEPFADGSAVPTRRVSEMAREGCKAVLSGDGGDEVFWGYPWYQWWTRAARVDLVPRPLRNAVAGTLASIPRIKGRQLLRQVAADPFERYAALLELFTPAEVNAVLSSSVRDRIRDHDTRWHLRRHWREDLDAVTRLQYLDLKTYLPDDILTKVDRASMAVGLEVRPALLDHRLVEAIFSLPAAIRVPGKDPKGLLKDVVRDRLPSRILAREKKGFSAPWNEWMRELGAWASDELRDGAAVQRGLLAPDPVARLGPGRRGPHVWSLLVLEWWSRQG